MSHTDNDKTPSLHQCIEAAREGDEDALNQLAGYLLPKAFEIARMKMQALSPMEDHEDIAVSAVRSICMRFRRGVYEFLGERELGGLLHQFVMTKVRNRRCVTLFEQLCCRSTGKNVGKRRAIDRFSTGTAETSGRTSRPAAPA